jgi:hypothetical protein
MERDDLAMRIEGRPLSEREHLAKRIEESPLNRIQTDFLLSRLKVASAEGCAAVVRDFNNEMAAYRMKVLASHRASSANGGISRLTKQGFALNTK